MKALSIRQPWASLLVNGCKLYEYRKTNYHYRGLVAIHASKTLEKRERQALANHEVQRCLPNVDDLPSGAVIAIGRLLETHFLTERRARAIRRDHPGEKLWGNPLQSWYALEFKIRPLSAPVAASGTLGLWNWEVPKGLKQEVDDISRMLSNDG
jgi:hypothetical protein